MMIDEFSHWFKISFSYRGKDFKFTIPIKSVDTNNDNWFYDIELEFDNNYIDGVVFGTILEDGTMTTNYQFGVDIFDENGDCIDTIDDVDIIDGE